MKAAVRLAFVLPSLVFGLALSGRQGLAGAPQVLNTRGLSGAETGWAVDPGTGTLHLNFGLAEVPGEINIPVSLQMDASSWIQPTNVMVYKYPDQPPVLKEVIFTHHPLAGSLTFGGATKGENVLLEDGRFIASWVTSAFGTFGFPAAFGLPPVAGSEVRLSGDGTLAKYVLSPSALGGPSALLKAPVGYPTPPSPQLKVVMDHERARIFGPAGSGYRPLLWLDRFGHYVQFQWTRRTTGLPSGLSAIEIGVATNQRGQGIQVQWAEPQAGIVPDWLMRVDYIGVEAPSVVVKGSLITLMNNQGATSNMIPAFTQLVGSYRKVTEETRWEGTSLLFRPTDIRIEDPRRIPSPSWQGAGAPSPTPPVGSMEAGQVWHFNYDGSGRELVGLTDPLGTTTTFTYDTHILQEQDGVLSNETHLRGVIRAEGGEGVQKRVQKWERHLPIWTQLGTEAGDGVWTDPNWTVKAWDFFIPAGSSDPTDARFHVYTYPLAWEGRDYWNGVPKRIERVGSNGTVLATDTFTYEGGGVAGTLSFLAIQTSSRAGEGTRTAVNSYTSGKLMTQSFGEPSGALRAITSYEYDAKPERLLPSRVRKVTWSRTGPGGSQPQVTAKSLDFDASSDLPSTMTWEGGADGNVTVAYTYDGEGRPSTSKPGASWGPVPAPASTTYEFSLDGRTLTQSVLDGAQQTLVQQRMVLDSGGRTLQTTDTHGVTTAFDLDLFGRVTSEKPSGSPSTTHSYGLDGRSETVSRGLITMVQERDGFGRVVRRDLPNALTEDLIYDRYGRLEAVRECNAEGSTRLTSTTYDDLDRVQATSQSDGKAISYIYETETQPDGAVWNKRTSIATKGSFYLQSQDFVNALGETVKIIEPMGAVSQFFYDGLGKPLRVESWDGNATRTTANTQVRTFVYDNLGRLREKTEPETGRQVFQGFTASGLPCTVIEAFGTADARTRTIRYDALGRPVNLTGGNTSLAFGYAGAELSWATRAVGGAEVRQEFTYGGAGGRLSQEKLIQDGLTAVVQYQYDDQGRLKYLTYPSGRKVRYDYDALSRAVSLVQISPSETPLVKSVFHDAWGNRRKLVFGSDAFDEWEMDSLGLRLVQWTPGVMFAPPNPRAYRYDEGGRLSQAGEWTTLTHNGNGQLARADGFGITTQHGHDAFGNNVLHSTNAQASSFNGFSFPPMVDNRVPAMTSRGAFTGWSTNGRGEAVQVGMGSGAAQVMSLVWDGLGSLAGVDTPAAQQRYAYAPSGHRVSLTDQLDPSRNRRYTYTDRGQLLSEFNGSGIWRRDVIYLGEEAVAEIDGGGIHELHNDHLGTPRVITYGPDHPRRGEEEARQAFGPYGEILPFGGYTAGAYTPLTGYTGHVHEDDTGLIYMRGRYYSPAWHRFVNSDQGLDANSPNQFAYAGGTPFHAKDPSGNKYMCWFLNITYSYADGTVKTLRTNTGDCFEIGTKPPAGGAQGGGGTPAGSDGSSSPKPQTPKVDPLSKDKCRALKLMLSQEKKYGTTGMALRQAYMLNIFDRMIGNTSRGNSIYFASQNNSSPTPTTMGPMDLDWFIHLKGVASTRWMGISIGAVAKQVWNAGYWVAGDKRWETPFQGDPGEALAADAYWAGKSLSDLFSPELLPQLCPE